MTKQITDETKTKFIEYMGDNYDGKSAWYEGYATALASHKLITETEFNELLELVTGIKVANIEDLVTTEMLKSITSKWYKSLLALRLKYYSWKYKMSVSEIARKINWKAKNKK